MVKQQKRKARPSWFQKQVERDGEQFLLRKTPTDIQREAFNIIRDICRGNITPRDYKYLFDTKVLSNVRFAVYNKYIESHVYDSSMAFVMQCQGGVQFLERNYGVATQNLQKIFNDNRRTLGIYSVILQNLDGALAFVQSPYAKTEEDYQRVYSSMVSQMSRFKYDI